MKAEPWATAYGGSFAFNTPMLYALGFIFLFVREKWMSMVNEGGSLYNWLAEWVIYFCSGSSSLVKRIVKLCLITNSEFPNWAANISSEKETVSKKLSKGVNTSKGTTYGTGLYLPSTVTCNVIKLGPTQQFAYRYYSTISSSGNGTGRVRKCSAKLRTVEPVSLVKYTKQPVEIIPFGIGKEVEDTISSKASWKADERTLINQGRQDEFNQIVEKDIFDTLRNLEKVNGKFRKLIRIIADEDMLKYAYSLIKSKAGNMTKSNDNLTLDGISSQWFAETAKKIKEGSFHFKPSREIDIPKPGKKGETRSLKIGNPRDKIVQKSCEVVLNYIYEEKLRKFSDNVHGFRSNKSPHTALEQIKYKWKAIPWYLEFDIKKAFDDINRKVLINIMGEEIEDQALFSLLNKMFNAKVIKGSEIFHTGLGVPQGNILSPLLSNIYFSKLDNEIEKLIKKYNKGDEPTQNLEYLKATVLTVEDRKGKTSSEIINLKKGKIKLARRNGLAPTIMDEKYCRVRYVRYADDFIIGVRGTKGTAKEIMKLITDYLKSNLHLKINNEKTKLTHIYSDKAHFLGMVISCTPLQLVPFRRAAHIERFRRLKLRVSRRIEMSTKARAKELQKRIIKHLQLLHKGKVNNISTTTNDLNKALNALNFKKEDVQLSNRSIIRKLARELIQLEYDEQTDKDLNDILKKLTEWTKKEIPNVINYKSNKDAKLQADDKGILQRSITKKEIGVRIFNKFGEVLELRQVPKAGFRYKPNITITYFPDNFALTEDEVKNIKEIPKRNTRDRYLAVIKLLENMQGTDKEVTKMDDPAVLGLRNTLENIGIKYGLPPQINANLTNIKNKLSSVGILNKRGSYGVRLGLLNAHDFDIVKYYKNLAWGILSYYRCADNLISVKKIVNYYIRYSLKASIQAKHKMNKTTFLKKYGENVTCTNYKGKEIKFLSNIEISNLKKQYLINYNDSPFADLEKIRLGLNDLAVNASSCAVNGCNNTDIEVHHIKQLFTHTSPGEGFTIITAGKTKNISGRLAIESALSRKQIPLCRAHHGAWHFKEIGPGNIRKDLSKK